MSTQLKLGFLGGGNMSSALIAGLARAASTTQPTAQSTAFASKQIFVHDRNATKMTNLADAYRIETCATPTALIENADILVLGVKPQSLKSVLVEHKQHIIARQPLIISVAAGVTTTTLQKWLDPNLAIVRAMPNTPALIGEGATGLYATHNTSKEQRQQALAILAAVGTCIWVESDADIDAVTALSGSGPAYYMLLTQALIRAAMNAGLSETVAQQLAIQTARGAALLVASSAKPLAVLIQDITSPKGTTEQAINALAAADLEGIVEQAFAAARARAATMATEIS